MSRSWLVTIVAFTACAHNPGVTAADPPCPTTVPVEAQIETGRSDLQIQKVCLIGASEQNTEALNALVAVRDPAPQLLRVWRRIHALMGTGLLSDVVVYTVPSKNSAKAVTLLYSVTEYDRLADVVVEGAPDGTIGWVNVVQPFLMDAIGKPLNPLALKRVMADMTAEYRTGGATHARIEAELEPIGPGEARARVKYAKGRWISSVRFEGNHRLADAELLERTELSVGEPYTQAKIDRVIAMLLSHYYDRGMIHASVAANPLVVVDSDADDVALRFVLVEGDVFRVGRLTFKGLTAGLERELRAVIATRAGQVFSRSQVAGDIEAMKVRASTPGFSAEVNVATAVNDKARTIDLTVEVVSKPR